MTTKSAQEIIHETVAYYGEDPDAKRGLNNAGRCVYCSDSGKMCAVGRCLLPRAAQHAAGARKAANALAKHLEEAYPDVYAGCNGVLDLILKPEYRGLPDGFWRGLQSLHDYSSNWCKSGGLSSYGAKAVRMLEAKYCRDKQPQ